MVDDQTLLRRFVADRDQAAFAKLVRRHIDLVYATALRRCRPEAEDVTQAVFLLLAEKGGSLTNHHSLGGWLHRTAGLCSANARKLAARRATHEREAAMQRNATSDDSADTTPPDELALLDDWISRLPADQREAVILRYLQNRSIDETAALLGLSVAVAAKRASRGLERLRDRAASHRFRSITSSAIGAFMIGQSTHRAPAALVQAATLAAPSSAAAKLIASKTTLSAAGSTAVTAGVAAVAVAILGVIAVMAANPWRSPPPAGGLAAAPSPAVAVAKAATRPAVPTPAEEAAVTGQTTMVRFSLIFKHDALAAINAASTAVPGSPALRLGAASDVLTALRTSIDQGQLVQHETNIRQGFDFSVGAKTAEPLRFEQYWNDFQFKSRMYTVAITWSSAAAVKAQQLPNQSIQLEMQDPGVEAFIQQYDQEIRFRNTVTVPVSWSGALTPGQALLLVHEFPAVGEDQFVSITVIQTYRCTEPQFDNLAHIQDSKDWIEQGPAGARLLADAAVRFAKAAPTDKPLLAATAARWTQTLDNGAIVHLVGSAAPSAHPFCWWDGDGHPLPASRNYDGKTDLSTPREVMINVSGLKDRLYGRTSDEEVHLLTEVDNDVQVWIGNGPFHEQPITVGQVVKLSDGFVKLTHVFGAGPTEVATFRGDLGPDIDAYIDVITDTGQRINTNADRSLLIADETTPRWKREDENIQVETAKPVKYILRWQERLLATFDGFADEPARAADDR